MDILEQGASLIFGTNADSYFTTSSGQEVLPNLVLKETHTDTVRTTQQPVEIGAAITDHSFVEPCKLSLMYYYSNTSIKGIIKNFTKGFTLSRGIANFGEGYCLSVYNKLITLKQKRELCKVVTYKRVYNNMLIKDIETNTDVENTYSMILNISMEELIMIEVGGGVGNGIQNNGRKQLIAPTQGLNT